MEHDYESITSAAISAIEAIAREARDSPNCSGRLLRLIAAQIYWSWADLAGPAARDDDSDWMEQVITAMSEGQIRLPRS